MVNGGSERKRRWKENKRQQGWAWSEIQGPRRGMRAAMSSESVSACVWSESNESVDSSSTLDVSRSVISEPLIHISTVGSSERLRMETFGRLRGKVNPSNPIHSVMCRLCKTALHCDFLVLDEMTSWKLVTVHRTWEDVTSQRVTDDLLRRDFICFHPDFTDRLGDRHFSGSEQVKMMRGGECYFTASGWTRIGLHVENMPQYFKWAVAFTGRPVGGLFTLIQLGIFVLGQVLTDGRVLLTQLVFPATSSFRSTADSDLSSSVNKSECCRTESTKSAWASDHSVSYKSLPSDPETASVLEPAALSARTSSTKGVPEDGSVLSFSDTAVSAYSPVSRGVSTSTPKRDNLCYKPLTYETHLSHIQEELSLVEFSPSIHYAALASKPQTLAWSYVQFVLQVLVDPQHVSKYPGTLQYGVWPAGLPFDSNLPDDELDWRLHDQTKVVPTGLLFLERNAHPFELSCQRQKEVSDIMIMRHSSSPYVWLFDLSDGKNLPHWRPFPRNVQEILNLSWKHGDAVSPSFSFELGITTLLSAEVGKETCGIESGDTPESDTWEVIFSIPAVRNKENRLLWLPVSTVATCEEPAHD